MAMPKTTKQAHNDHENRVADARATAVATVKTAAAAYNGLASGYATFAASVASAEATRDSTIAASIVTKQADLDAIRHEAWLALPPRFKV